MRDASPLSATSEVDRAGRRVMVGKGSAYDLYLTRELKAGDDRARAESPPWSTPSWRGTRCRRRREAAARGGRQAPRRLAAAARPLHGDPAGDGAAQGRRGAAAEAALAAFVEEQKASGAVQAALSRHGITVTGGSPAEVESAPMSFLHRWLWPFLLAPCLAFGQGAVVKTDEVPRRTGRDAPEGVVARQAALARPADPPRAAVAHLLEEPRRLRPAHDAELEAARRHVQRRRDRVADAEAAADRSARQLRLRGHGAAAGARRGRAGLPRAPSLDVGLRADWLVCKEVCIPQSGDFRLAVPAGPAPPRTRSVRAGARRRSRGRCRTARCGRRSTRRRSRSRSTACRPACAARRSTFSPAMPA